LLSLDVNFLGVYAKKPFLIYLLFLTMFVCCNKNTNLKNSEGLEPVDEKIEQEKIIML